MFKKFVETVEEWDKYNIAWGMNDLRRLQEELK